ncbi:hypothetical protein [Amycolatopsis lexingtonensis]|uniref:hypothetical protein n=1 Tax=Amycolatopsis lexingtonensis TaxID=218822 RepID=UPI003F70D816
MTNPTDELRAAAKLLRERAAAATAGPWRTHDGYVPGSGFVASVLSGDGADTDLRAWLPTFSNDTELTKRNVLNDAGWIALASPVLAEPLACLLEEAALRRDRAEGFQAHAENLAGLLLDGAA